MTLFQGEVIQIHIGQAGVQIANACWELYCLEHAIAADGSICKRTCDDNFTAFFNMNESEKVNPRAVLVDSEPTVIDQIRTGPYGKLYSPNSLISGKEDSGSNFARGYYTMGAELIDVTMEAIRTVSESCCNLKGFLIFRSIGGGTGSGLGNLIIEEIYQEYDKVPRLEFIIFPSPSISPLIVEPYNALLASHFAMDAIDCSCILDNEALYEICSARLNIFAPKYKNLNRIIGQTVSTFTASQRFLGNSNISFAEIQTNLVPYPRIHFPVVSYAPFIPGTSPGFPNFSTSQITQACFSPSNQLIRCTPADGKNMTCVLLYRGNVSTSSINSSINRLKIDDTVRFVDWSPTSFKVGINHEAPFTIPGGGLGASNQALAAFSNNTVIQYTWCRLISKYNRLFSRRSFIHHFIAEGLEEDAFNEASEDICALVSDYLEVDDGQAANFTQESRKINDDHSNSENFKTSKNTFSNESIYESDHSPVRRSKSIDIDISLKAVNNVEQQSKSYDVPKCENMEDYDKDPHKLHRCISQVRYMQPTKRCGANEVLRLPPIKREGTVRLGEAVIAKQRFSQSTYKPQALIDSDCCDSNEMLVANLNECCDPCCNSCDSHSVEDDYNRSPTDSFMDLYCELCPSSSCEDLKPPQQHPCYDPPFEDESDSLTQKRTCLKYEKNRNCAPEFKRTKCFCCIDTDDVMYVNSDDFLPKCCKPPRYTNSPRSSSCHQKQSRNDYGTPSNSLKPSCCFSYQEEELLHCPSNDRICECYLESEAMSAVSLIALPPPKTEMLVNPSSSPETPEEKSNSPHKFKDFNFPPNLPQIMFQVKEKKIKNKEHKTRSNSK